MSFSLRAKNELARVNGRPCCNAAELAALVKTGGRLTRRGRRLTLEIGTENAAVARKVFKLAKEVDRFAGEISIRKHNRLNKNGYVVVVRGGENLASALRLLGCLDGGGRRRDGIKRGLVNRDCCRRAYLRGAFLARGSLSGPASAYHLEIPVRGELDARGLVDLMERLGVEGRVGHRKRAPVVYIKESEQISRCLSVMGAHTTLLHFENLRIYKEMRNRVNRLVNCDTANVNKAVDAGVRQQENVKLVVNTLGLANLPSPLREIARLRLAHPGASLRELGELARPPLTKSCVNHRMRRLESLAQALRREREE
ncbi:MAG: DNA-binding protein WhiA [Desulfotomaculales bacterium]